MKEYTKIGFIYVFAGLAGFVVSSTLAGVIGWYDRSTGIAIACAAMSAVMMQACKAAYMAGKRSVTSTK